MYNLKFEFRLKFYGGNSYGYAVNKPQRYLGWKDIDTIRIELGIDLDLDRIQGFIPEYHRDPTIEINEKIARRYDFFEHTNSRTILVRKERLNEYLTLSIKTDKNATTGEIINAKLNYELDTISIIHDIDILLEEEKELFIDEKSVPQKGEL